MKGRWGLGRWPPSSILAIGLLMVGAPVFADAGGDVDAGPDGATSSDVTDADDALDASVDGDADEPVPDDARTEADVSVQFCTPGAQFACPCPNGGVGIQICAADGMSVGACESCVPDFACKPGASVPCLCTLGYIGVQECRPQGNGYGACHDCRGSSGCVPGAQFACSCASRGTGVQACGKDANSLSECSECSDAGLGDRDVSADTDGSGTGGSGSGGTGSGGTGFGGTGPGGAGPGGSGGAGPGGSGGTGGPFIDAAKFDGGNVSAVSSSSCTHARAGANAFGAWLVLLSGTAGLIMRRRRGRALN